MNFLRPRFFLLGLASLSGLVRGQIITDADIPAILDDGSADTTAYYQIGETSGYAFTLSQTGENFMLVGNDNPRNSLTINNGASADFEGGGVTVGAGATSTHNFLGATGSGTSVTSVGALRVGTSGSSNNQLTVQTNASWTNSGDIYVGQIADSNSNSLSVSGGASFTNADSRQVYVGYRGSYNSLLVTSEAEVTLSDRLEIGYYGSLSTVQVSGSGTLLDVGNRIQFGRGGGENNTLGVYGGATLLNGNDVTFYGSNNAMIVDGVGSTATLTGLDLGYNGSTGNHLTVSGGGLLELTQADVDIVTGNTLRLDGGFIAWRADRTANFASLITGSAIEISDGSGGWITATADDLAIQYFGSEDALAAEVFSGYGGLGGYTIIGLASASAVPEPGASAMIGAFVVLGTTLLRRRRKPRPTAFRTSS